MNRRELLKASIALPTSTLLSCTATDINAADYLISATYDHNGGHQLLVQQLNNTIKAAYSLPFRGHDVLLHENRIIVFGRRPETRCFVIDQQTRQTQIVQAAKHRHFYGHGVVHKNALLTTENNYEDGVGVIGIRDRDSLQRIGEYSLSLIHI